MKTFKVIINGKEVTIVYESFSTEPNIVKFNIEVNENKELLTLQIINSTIIMEATETLNGPEWDKIIMDILRGRNDQ